MFVTFRILQPSQAFLVTEDREDMMTEHAECGVHYVSDFRGMTLRLLVHADRIPGVPFLQPSAVTTSRARMVKSVQ